MTLFEYDQGHLIPAQFGRPVDDTISDEVLDAVRRQVLEVIARPLFPVTWSAIAALDANDGPRLTALDSSGQVVSVEVMARLNASSLIAALARLGAVSTLGWKDLAETYPGGVDAFRSGWTQFRDSMPPRLEPGPRLIVVATVIDPDVRPALEALAASGLEVHQVSVREMSSGRRFLDVQQVHSSLFSHDVTLLAGRAARVPELSATYETDETPASKARGAIEEPPVETGSISRQSIMEASRGPAEGSAEPDFKPKFTKPAPAPEPPAEPAEGEYLPPDFGTPEDAIAAYGQIKSFGGKDWRDAPSAEELGGAWANVGKGFKPVDGSDAPAPEEKPEGEEIYLLRHDAQGLRALAEIIDGDAPLLMEVGGCTVEAELTAEGVIFCEGEEWDDPNEAAVDLGDSLEDIDGWEAWHLGSMEGPTLAEACAETNREIERMR